MIIFGWLPALVAATLLAAACGGTPSTPFNPVPHSELSQRPTPRFGPIPAPQYPTAAREGKAQGSVTLRVFIDERGRVEKVQILEDPGCGLGEAAARSMRKVLWNPAIDLNGDPVDTIIIYRYMFVLDPPKGVPSTKLEGPNDYPESDTDGEQ